MCILIKKAVKLNNQFDKNIADYFNKLYFLGDEGTTTHIKNYKKEDNPFKLWNRILQLNSKIFKKNKYEFNYMIRTDGILFIRLGSNGLPLKYYNPNTKLYLKANKYNLYFSQFNMF